MNGGLNRSWHCDNFAIKFTTYSGHNSIMDEIDYDRIKLDMGTWREYMMRIIGWDRLELSETSCFDMSVREGDNQMRCCYVKLI